MTYKPVLGIKLPKHSHFTPATFNESILRHQNTQNYRDRPGFQRTMTEREALLHSEPKNILSGKLSPKVLLHIYWI